MRQDEMTLIGRQASGDIALPLRGVKVIELGHSVAGPHAGLILAGLGADVIKLERVPGKDPARDWGPPFWEGMAPHFLCMNRGKRSFQFNMDDPVHLDWLSGRLRGATDVFVSNIRPRSLERRGLDAKSITGINSKLIACEIGAYGKGGKLEGLPGYDPLMQAYSGLMSLTGEGGDRPPIRVGVSMIDLTAGIWAALGIVAALKRRETSGAGGIVETSLLETAISFMQIPLSSYEIQPREMQPRGSGAEGIVPYQAFKVSGRWIVIACGSDALFCRFCNVLGREGWASDERFSKNSSRVRNRKVLISLIEQELTGWEVDDLIEKLVAAGIPYSPVNTVPDVLACDHVSALGILQTIKDENEPRLANLPLKFDGVRPEFSSTAPTVEQCEVVEHEL